MTNTASQSPKRRSYSQSFRHRDDSRNRGGRQGAQDRGADHLVMEHIAVAFVPATSVPKAIGALYLGREKGGGLVYGRQGGNGLLDQHRARSVQTPRSAGREQITAPRAGEETQGDLGQARDAGRC
jgi:hypothetical protein